MSAQYETSLLYDVISAGLKGEGSVADVVRRAKTTSLPRRVVGPKSAFVAYVLARLARDVLRPIVCVVASDAEGRVLVRDLEAFGVSATLFEWFGTAPYRSVGAGSAVSGRRAQALHSFRSGECSVLVVSAWSAATILPARFADAKEELTLRPDTVHRPENIAERLVSFGYWRVPRVSVHGEFAVRGEVIDVFAFGNDSPTRIAYDFDRIEGLRDFDPFSQTSQADRAELTVYPVASVLNEDAVARYRHEAHLPEFRHVREAMLAELEHPDSFPSYWHAALNTDRSLLFGAVPDSTIFAWNDLPRLRSVFAQLAREFEAAYESERYSRPLPEPERLFVPVEDLLDGVSRRSVFFDPAFDTREGDVTRIACDPPRSFFGNVAFLKEELATLMEQGYACFIFADTDAQRRRVEHLLSEYPAIHHQTGRLSGGFTLPAARVAVVQEAEIFGRRKRAPASLQRTESRPIDTFVELDEGDHVVHVSYGIGIFRGIQRMKAGGNERDYVQLEYADQESVFVPIEQVNLVQRYIGSSGAAPRLDRIGGKSWEKRKGTVRKNVEDLAERLIKIYSRRKKTVGFSFPDDTEWQIEFESSFDYEETPDQLRCIAEIKADMERPVPMDRLLCGDVGYGKTEVALRAAFKAVTSGKQVALLAPTTILVEQHFETIQERFDRFPVRIAMLSRFVPRSEQMRTVSEVAAGKVDLVVGTHRLLQKDVRFKDLGLLVIDEEQRFGVKAKEILKEMKSSVDCLTLTATPIPRTLHMSLLRIRDMSLLTTPPRNRHAIETVIAEFSEETVAGAIRRELDRGGQVFFLHNRVETLENVRRFIEKLVPEALVDTAHGQMAAPDLEEIMHRFVHGAFQVLVATTIIENGIDIPNVNTIIIDRADNYGISQLYQLRGRVGRSDRIAYAYLCYPDERVLSEIAMKRLRVISDFTELGSGFKIALKDLEVRGAGNLLGHQQSGDILSVGFDLYLKLLDEAVRELEEDRTGQGEEVYLELEYSGFIPDSYIPEMMEKMEVYKKIASVSEQPAFESLLSEIEDRFGPIPDELNSLMTLAELRILARSLHVSSLRERGGELRVEFGRVASLSVERVLALVHGSGGAVRLDPRAPNVLIMDTGSVGLKEKSEFIRGRLTQLV